MMKWMVIFWFGLMSIIVNGQEISDSIVLKDVVYTGQVSPQKINSSVYEVTVIDENQIQQAAAVNLADLLNQTLNIQVLPNPSTGKSGLNLLGLNSQYIKVLVDNIPIINDEGLGNFTDFTQINLSDIQQIEIVEGAMAVEYGSNAVSGVINIITKKSANKNLETKVYIQEESINNEYNLSDEGRHIAGIDLKKRITYNLHAGINYNHNLFEGYYGEKQGKRYALNDELRGYEWQPKQQYDAKGFLSYRLGKSNFFYRANYFEEKIQRYNATVNPNYNPQFDLNEPTAQDARFNSKRWYHLLNANGKAWKYADYSLSLSFQKQDKNANFYTYDILNNTRSNENKFTYESRKTLYSKFLLEQVIQPQKWSIQWGVELNNIEGKQSPLARSFDSSTETKERELGSYDFFMSSNIHVSDNVTVRPGIRTLFSSRFNTVFAYSLSTSYFFKQNWELRGIIGSSPKSPSYEQLYTYFVDSNHHVVGNEELKVERGNSAFLHLKKRLKFNNKNRWNSKLSLFYLQVKDKVELVISNEQPLEYTYLNFDTFTNRGITFSNQFSTERINAQLGLTYSGVGYESSENKLLYGFQGNFLVNYTIPKVHLHLTSNFKYYGPQYSWNYDIETEELVKGKLNAYAWWDLSARKEILNKLNLTVGVRNVTDIVSVKTTAASAGAHSDKPVNRLLGYGRSFFLNLTYDIPFK